MIQTLSKIKVIDNTGTTCAKVIRILEGNKIESANLGSFLVITVKKCSSNAKVKKGEIYKLRLLRSKETINRKDGINLKFDNNGGIILNQQLAPLGSRIIGPLPREIKRKYYKISNICKTML
jgi:large subunit ribosomal protein L14